MVEFDNPYERVEIRGWVVGFIEDTRAESQLDGLAKRYLKLDVYPWRKPGEKRVVLHIQPTNVIHHHDTDDPGTLPVA